MVLIHGVGSSAGAWDKVVPFLERGFRLWLYEIPGHGDAAPISNLTIDSATLDLTNYLEENDVTKPILVGHGLGGMIAMNFAYRYASDVRKLVIIDAAPVQLASRETKTRIAEQLMDNYDAFFSEYFLGLSALHEVTEIIVDQAMRTDQVSATQLLMSSFDFDLTADLGYQDTPILVIASATMIPNPEIAVAHLDGMGYANASTLNYKVMSDAGHFVMLEQPLPVVGAIVGFSITE
jgi:pimeloyl-ACP methyl ester carboxylesterase